MNKNNDASRGGANEAMVEMPNGEKLPVWLVASAHRISHYMGARYHCAWELAGIQSRRGDRVPQPAAAGELPEAVADAIDVLTKCSCAAKAFNRDDVVVRLSFALEAVRKLYASAAVAECRRDAERYRALVASGAFSPGRFPSCPWGLRTGNAGLATKAELDAAADAAVAAMQEAGR